MVKYIKSETPLCLVDSKRKDAFETDKLARAYTDTKSLYKCKKMEKGIDLFPIKETLKKIYKNKCAYCETRFNRSFISIEHYRPKKSDIYLNGHQLYYFLAYSWSNLFPICDVCNTKKSNNFEIENENNRITYNNESLQNLQYITELYNHIEKPKFIHPEIDNYEDLFRFNKYGEIIVFSDKVDSYRMTYTINNSDLNEKDLSDRRAKVLTDFINIKNELFETFDLVYASKDREKINKFKDRTKFKIEEFFNDTNEFIAVRKFIIQRINLFLLGLDKIFTNFFHKLIDKYIKTIAVYDA